MSKLNFGDKMKPTKRPSAADDLMTYKQSYKFEDNFTRRTLWVRNDLLEKLDATGNRTKALERALEDYFEREGHK